MNLKMESSRMRDVLYSFNGLFYKVTDSEEVHASLSGKNPDAFADYLRQNIERVELLGVAEIGEAGTGASVAQSQQDSEQKKSEYLWTRDTIKLLLEEYKKRAEDFRSSTSKKTPLWSAILRVFEQKGYAGLTTTGLDDKMRGLKKTFRRINLNKNKTKKGKRAAWEYFDEMAEIFHDDANIDQAAILGSSTFPQASDSFLEEPISPSWDLPANEISISSETPVSAIKSQSTHKAQRRLEFPRAKGRRIEMEDNVSPRKRMKTNRIRDRQNLAEQRRENLELEKDRVGTLQNILAAVRQSNNIQKERNELLKQLIEKL